MVILKREEKERKIYHVQFRRIKEREKEYNTDRVQLK